LTSRKTNGRDNAEAEAEQRRENPSGLINTFFISGSFPVRCRKCRLDRWFLPKDPVDLLPLHRRTKVLFESRCFVSCTTAMSPLQEQYAHRHVGLAASQTEVQQCKERL